jgi:uncharacterized protein
MATMPDFEKAKEYVLKRLEHELSPSLAYHGLKHTLQEVVPAADLLATLEKVSDEDRLLLLTAAYFHDLGFICQRIDHELISIQFAEQTLPGLGYSDRQIGVIRGIIQATCLPQSPTTLLERIMADSDLDYLGHEDFWVRSNDFRQELDHFGQKFTDMEWYAFQLRFMESHNYFTKSEQELRNAIKQQHIEELKELFDQANRLK